MRMAHRRVLQWFADSPLTVGTVDVAVRLMRPFAAFGAPISNASMEPATVSAVLMMRSGDETYSVFEVGVRAVFVRRLSLCLDHIQRRAAQAQEHRSGLGVRRTGSRAGASRGDGAALDMVALSAARAIQQPALCRASAWAADHVMRSLQLLPPPCAPSPLPPPACQLIYPTRGAAVFGALATCTFVAALLLFWLVTFHLAALPRPAPSRKQGQGAANGPRSTSCDWGPYSGCPKESLRC